MKRIFIPILALIAFTPSLSARQPQKGYRGFLDWSNSIKRESFGSYTHNNFYTGFSTSHGYQITPWIFAGAGIDLENCSHEGITFLALFAEGRTDLKFGMFTPFGDIRIGYNNAYGGGVYFSPTIGYRFNWGRKVGINIGVGLTLRSYHGDIYDIVQDPENGWWIWGDKIGSYNGSLKTFSFRVGLDF